MKIFSIWNTPWESILQYVSGCTDDFDIHFRVRTIVSVQVITQNYCIGMPDVLVYCDGKSEMTGLPIVLKLEMNLLTKLPHNYQIKVQSNHIFESSPLSILLAIIELNELITSIQSYSRKSIQLRRRLVQMHCLQLLHCSIRKHWPALSSNWSTKRTKMRFPFCLTSYLQRSKSRDYIASLTNALLSCQGGNKICWLWTRVTKSKI